MWCEKTALIIFEVKKRFQIVLHPCFSTCDRHYLSGSVFTVGVTVTAVVFALHVFNPEDVHLALVPAAAAAAAAAAINAVFFTAYAEAIETILQCFCEDLERNDGSALRAYYMPDSLKQLVLEKIRKPPDEREADEAFSKEAGPIVYSNKKLSLNSSASSLTTNS